MRCAHFNLWMIGLSLMAGAAFGDSTYRVIEVEKGGVIAGTIKLVGDYPHIQVFRPQPKLTIRNNDGVLHNIHAYTAGQTLLNAAIDLIGAA